MTRIPFDWTTVYGITQYPGGTGTKKFVPVTPWIQAARVQRIKAVWEMIVLQTNLSVQFGFQVANVENSATSDATNYVVDSAVTADGFSYGAVTDISTHVDDKQLVRFGFYTWNTAGALLVAGRVGGYVDIDANS